MSPIPLSSLRPDPRTESELRWFFTAAAGEMGLRSNWEAYAREGMYLTRRRSTYSVDIASIMPDLRGAHRASPIMRALNELEPEQRGILSAAYGDLRETMKAWPALTENQAAELTLAFRDLTGVVPWAAQEAHQRSRTTRPVVDWLIRLHRRAKSDRAAAAAKAEVVREAEAQVMAATRAFSAAKKLRRRAG